MPRWKGSAGAQTTLAACFDEDFRSEQPRHPDRDFTGRARVERNWVAPFAGVTDFRAELLRAVEDAGAVRAEWRRAGTRTGGNLVDLRGVTIPGVEGGLIKWARLCVDEVD